MSDHTPLIIKLIEARAMIEDSDPRLRYGMQTESESSWSDGETNIAITALQDLIRAAHIKLERLNALAARRQKLKEAVGR